MAALVSNNLTNPQLATNMSLEFITHSPARYLASSKDDRYSLKPIRQPDVEHVIIVDQSPEPLSTL